MTFIFDEHPTKEIRETKGSELKGKVICLCICGSVAAVQSSAIARELIRHGAEVVTVMTQSATELIHPNLMEWSTGNKAITRLTGKVEHIQLAGVVENSRGKADLVLVCPATANTISKMAVGIDDNAVTTVLTTAIGSNTPIIVVPAMHASMFSHPILKQNIKLLEKIDVDFIMPRMIEQKAKIATIEEIVTFAINKLTPKKEFIQKKFLITAGAAREFIDQVRFISNPSTGKMGICLAEIARAKGAKVTLVLGQTSVAIHPSIEVIRVVSTEDFLNAIKSELERETYDVFISAAAIADFTPKDVVEKKISSDLPELSLTLKSTPKIIDTVRKMAPELFMVGFKAETQYYGKDLAEKAFKRLEEAKLDLIVANNVASTNVGRGFACDTNEVYIVNSNHEITHVQLASKRIIAEKICEHIAKQLLDKE